MEREQVIKALECWASGKPCEGGVCDLFDASTFTCDRWTGKNALSLIKELTEEKKKLEYTLAGVMHSVDKWLDGKELEQDEVNRAATMREKTLQIVEKLTEENERLKKHAISYETPLEKQTIPNLCSLEGAAAVLYLQIENQIKADTVRKMQSEIEARCIKGGIYPAFVKSTIDQIAEEMVEGDK